MKDINWIKWQLLYNRARFLRTLKWIGSGSSRDVYLLPSKTKVVKVAQDGRGIAQNRAEVKIYETIDVAEYVAKIFYVSKSFSWIISEYCVEVGELDIDPDIEHYLRKHTGLHEVKEFGRDRKGAIKIIDYGGTTPVLRRVYGWDI